MKTISKLLILIKTVGILTLLTIITTTFYSCSQADCSNREEMREQMTSLMDDLRDAAVELNAEKVIDLCLDSPEFLFFSDGLVFNYEQFVKAEREDFPNYTNHELSWDTLYVKILGSDVITALAPFHQKVTHKNETVTKLKGEVTWIATRTDDGLKLIYGHARHQVDTTSN